MAEAFEIMNYYEGIKKGVSDAVAILKTASAFDVTEDYVKEAIYGKAS